MVGKEDDLLGKVPYAYVTRNDDKISKQDICDYCYNKMSDYKVPKDIIFVKKIAKTQTGKIRRNPRRL